MSSEFFLKSQRILKREEFKTVLHAGVRKTTQRFILFLLPNARNCNRLGIIVTKKVANSVKRNRLKRLIREYFRISYSKEARHLPFHDVVFISKKGSACLTLEDIRGDIGKLYEKRFNRGYHGVSKDTFTLSSQSM